MLIYDWKWLLNYAHILFKKFKIIVDKVITLWYNVFEAKRRNRFFNKNKGENVMIENKIISEFLGEINGVEFKNSELYERCLGTLRIIGTAKEIDEKAVKGTKDFYVNLQNAKNITLKEIDDIASYGLFNSNENFDWKTFKEYDSYLLNEENEDVVEILKSFTDTINSLPNKK